MAASARIPSYVIAIAGSAVGAGKTTLMRKVTERLGDAVSVQFNAYEHLSIFPADTAEWLRSGADPDEFRTPQLTEAVRDLREGTSVIHPRLQTVVEPAAYIVLEEPFGRSRSELTHLIDFVACIDTPPEIALARRLFEWAERASDPGKFLDRAKGYLRAYLHGGSHELYSVVSTLAKADCELVLDGTQDPDLLADQVAQAVHARR